MELLRDMQRTGMLDSMAQTVRQESQLPVGAMTDGSKRCLPNDVPEFGEEDFQHVTSEEMLPTSMGPYPSDVQQPMIFQFGASKQRPSSGVGLPEGVESLEEWGRTICELPKVKDLAASYQELLNLSDSGDTKMASYLNWIRNYRRLAPWTSRSTSWPALRVSHSQKPTFQALWRSDV